MLKTALFDCAINEKCCSVDGGRGICPLFSSPPRGIWQLKSPHPRDFAIQGKKNANAWGSARVGEGGGAGRRWNWLMHNELISLGVFAILCGCTSSFFSVNAFSSLLDLIITNERSVQAQLASEDPLLSSPKRSRQVPLSTSGSVVRKEVLTLYKL